MAGRGKSRDRGAAGPRERFHRDASGRVEAPQDRPHGPDRRDLGPDSGRLPSGGGSGSGGSSGGLPAGGFSKPEKSQGGPSDESRRGRMPLRVVARGLNPERLAKLVASDMLLYNRDKIERTSERGNLLSSMAPEIVEAWEFYKGRVGDEVAKGTSHFRDAINGILGGEDSIL